MYIHKLAVATLLATIGIFANSASAEDKIEAAPGQEVKVTCSNGVTFWVAPETNAEGKIVFGGEPKIVKIRCRDKDEGDANVFMVDGIGLTLRVHDIEHAGKLFDLISTAGDLPAAPKPGS
jgi:hypothetical protein